jgi:hypothetical protein
MALILAADCVEGKPLQKRLQKRGPLEKISDHILVSRINAVHREFAVLRSLISEGGSAGRPLPERHVRENT